jgi:hypothetical protein
MAMCCVGAVISAKNLLEGIIAQRVSLEFGEIAMVFLVKMA